MSVNLMVVEQRAEQNFHPPSGKQISLRAAERPEHPAPVAMIVAGESVGTIEITATYYFWRALIVLVKRRTPEAES